MDDAAPLIFVSGSYNYSNNNTTIQFLGQPETKIDGAASSNLAGSVGLNYTLFNGLGTLYGYQKLKAAESL